MTITAEVAANIEKARIRTEKRELEKARIKGLYDNPETIQIGEGVTIHTGMGGLYSPFTVIETRRNGRELVIQRDRSEFPEGYNWAGDTSGVIYHRDLTGRIDVITKRNDGTYIAKGAPKEWYATRYSIGSRRDWTDYSQ